MQTRKLKKAAASPGPLIRVWRAGERNTLPRLSSGGVEKIAPEEEEDSLQPDAEGCQRSSEIHGYSRSLTLRSPWWRVWGVNSLGNTLLIEHLISGVKSSVLFRVGGYLLGQLFFFFFSLWSERGAVYSQLAPNKTFFYRVKWKINTLNACVILQVLSITKYRVLTFCSKANNQIALATRRFRLSAFCVALRPRHIQEQDQTNPPTPSVTTRLTLSRPGPVRALHPQQHLLHPSVPSLR